MGTEAGKATAAVGDTDVSHNNKSLDRGRIHAPSGITTRRATQ